MKVQGFGRQDRIKIALTRQDAERLWKMAQQLPGASPDEIVEVTLVAEHDYGWEIPEPPTSLRIGIAWPTGSEESVSISTNSKWHLPKNRRAEGRVIRTP